MFRYIYNFHFKKIFTLINIEWIMFEMQECFHNVCYCSLISVQTETYWQVYQSSQISWNSTPQFLWCYSKGKRDKTKLMGTFLHLFTVDLQNTIPRFPLQSGIHLKEPKISTTLEAFDQKKNIGMQAEMLDLLRQRFPKFLLAHPFWLQKVTTDPHILVHANTECPDNRYPKSKIYISDLISDS